MARKPILNILIVVLAIGTGLAMSSRPWQVYREQRRQTEVQVKATKDIQMRHITNLRRAAFLESESGKEFLAREKGYHRPGEIPISGDTP